MTATIIHIGPMAVLNTFANASSLAQSVPVDILATLAEALSDPKLKSKRRLFIAQMRHSYSLNGKAEITIRTTGRNTIFGIDAPDVTKPTDFITPQTTVSGEVLMPGEVYVFEVQGNTIHHYAWTYGDADKAWAELVGDTDTNTGC